MTENSLISIVIPVYNGESYLPRCIESVLSQSYKNLEIIIVNDGSTDKSPYICDGYRKRDKRIKVIHRKNAGPGAARGEGVRVATGDYIAFVDADDFIDKNMYKHLRIEAKDGIDIIQCGFRKVSTTGEVLETNELEPIDISGTFECAYYYASQKNTTNFLWNKLYKADLFKKVVFPKQK
jgi:glycosyltransferase involved in cell wall biosynthesis